MLRRINLDTRSSSLPTLLGIIFANLRYMLRRMTSAAGPRMPFVARPDGRRLLGLDCPLSDPGPSTWGYHPQFPNAIEYWCGTARTLREKSMIAFMNQITDKPDWTRKIRDHEIVRKWKSEAAQQARTIRPEKALTERMVDYCIKELGDYAQEFDKHGFIPAIRADATCFKSDTIISEDLKLALRAAVAPLEDVLDKHKDWHPGSDEKVLDLVHPSLFPLIYGTSKILREGTVSLEDCELFIGKGEIMPVPELSHTKVNTISSLSSGRYSKQLFYSLKYQWLPCEVAFRGTDQVQISSHINNLHPRGNESLYGVIEKIIERTIPIWDATLASLREKMGSNIRIHVNSPYYEEPEGKRPPTENEDDPEEWDVDELDDQWERDNRKLIYPEPSAYTAEDDSSDNSGYRYPVLQHPRDDNEVPRQGLRQMFADQGLQIIVKLANIHLTPDKPTYDGGSWHVEGQLNEHICASTLYYYDSENITDSYLAFRESMDPQELDNYEQSDYEHLEILYGIQDHESAIQELGSVLTRENRLLTFPNVFQHQVSSFKLADPSRPGHRKILALFLVDPYCRIPSTANVPPQQKEWWRDMVQAHDQFDNLPVEIVDRIVDGVEDFPIGLEEAKEMRLELMEERKMYANEVDDRFASETFFFCEH